MRPKTDFRFNVDPPEFGKREEGKQVYVVVYPKVRKFLWWKWYTPCVECVGSDLSFALYCLMIRRKYYDAVLFKEVLIVPVSHEPMKVPEKSPNPYLSS